MSFSSFQYGFGSSQSTANLVTVVSDRTARDFNRSVASRAVALDISTAFDRVWQAFLPHKRKSYGISGQIFGLISSFFSNRRLRVVLDTKSSLEFLKALFLVLHLPYYSLMTFLIMLSVILLFILLILLSKRDQASDLWQKLELASELESDLQDTVDWDRKWLVDLNAEKTQMVSFVPSNNTGAINVKMDGFVLEEKKFFKDARVDFLS